MHVATPRGVSMVNSLSNYLEHIDRYHRNEPGHMDIVSYLKKRT